MGSSQPGRFQSVWALQCWGSCACLSPRESVLMHSRRPQAFFFVCVGSSSRRVVYQRVTDHTGQLYLAPNSSCTVEEAEAATLLET